MKIWICGANGMLAKHFISLLQERQIDFLATSKTQVDITDKTSVLRFMERERFTHLINCAAYTAVDKAEAEKQAALNINNTGPEILALSADQFDIPILHFSTDYVFDGKSTEPYLEDDPHAPLNFYGYSKSLGEKDFIRNSKKGCLIRTSWLFGTTSNNFVKTMLKLMKEKETLRIVIDQIGRPTFCGDLAEASLELFKHAGVYHYANSNETSWYGFAKEIHRQGLEWGYSFKVKDILPITTAEYPTAAARPSYSVLSTEKVELFLGKSPRPWQEALHDYFKQVSHE